MEDRERKGELLSIRVLPELKGDVARAGELYGEGCAGVIRLALAEWFRTHAPQKALSARRRRFKAE